MRSVTRLIRPILFSEIINSGTHIEQILPSVLENLSDEKDYGFVQQDDATARSACKTISVLRTVLSERKISRLLWTVLSPL